MNQDALEFLSNENNLSTEDKNKLIAIFNKYIMNNKEVKEKIIEMSPDLEKLFELWSSTKLRQFTLLVFQKNLLTL